MEASEQRVRLRVSPLAYLAAIAAAVLLLTMVGLLIVQVVILKDSREHIAAQDHKLAQLQGNAQPLLNEARPAVRQAEPLIRRVRRLLGPAGQSLDNLTAATDRVPRLVMGVDIVLSEAIPLLRALNATDAPGVLASVGRLTEDFRAAGIVRAIDATGDLALDLTAGGRTVRLVDSANHTLAVIDREDLLGRAAYALDRVPVLERRFRRLARIQRRSLIIQARQLRVQFRTLAVQQEALQHIRSIDRKTGPAPPATAVTPAAP